MTKWIKGIVRIGLAVCAVAWILLMQGLGDDPNRDETLRSIAFFGVVGFLCWFVLVLGGFLYWQGEPVWPYSLLFFGMLSYPFIALVWPALLVTLGWGGYRWTQRRKTMASTT